MFLLFGGGASGSSLQAGSSIFLFPPLIVLDRRRREALLAAIRSGRARSLAIAFLYLTWGALLALLEELLNQGPMWLFAPSAIAAHPARA